MGASPKLKSERLMRNLLLLAAIAGLPFGGCGGGEKYTTFADEITVKVVNPANAKIDRYSGTLWDGNGGVAGTRHIHTSTDSAGVKKECTVELAGSFAKSDPMQLTINGRGYGSVVKGDSIVIDCDMVKVNGTERGASPPERARNASGENSNPK
jgi:hypothetical protein